MKIKTLVDETEGEAAGYEDRGSVSLYLTPGEAHDLRVSLGDLLAQKDENDDGWHAHVRGWDEACEIVLLLDREGALHEPTPEEHLNRWLAEHAQRGGSIVQAVNAVAESHRVDTARAKELLREHPAWSERV